MFNNNVEDEADFCEAYKSQILNDDSSEKGSSVTIVLKIVTILLLLAIIIGISIYGYNYFMNNSNTNSKVSAPPVSIQTLEENELDDLKVELEPIRKKISINNDTIQKVEVKSIPVKSIEELDIDQIANDVKLAIAKNEEEELKVVKSSSEKIEPIQIPVEDEQSAYLEELAKLSKEIDKERE